MPNWEIAGGCILLILCFAKFRCHLQWAGVGVGGGPVVHCGLARGSWVSPGPGHRNLAVPSTGQLTLATRQWVLTLARASSSTQDK